MYAIRYSLDIEGDIQRDWSAWMGMRYASFLDLVNSAGEISEYEYSEWCESRDLDETTEEAAEEYVTEKLGWDVRIDPKTGEFCAVHHDGLSCYVVDEEDLDATNEVAARWNEKGALPSGEGKMTVGAVEVVTAFGNWYVLKCDGLNVEP